MMEAQRSRSLAITATEPARTAPRMAIAYVPNVPLPVVGSSWKVPGSAHPDLPALVVLDAILTNGDNSRLHQSLVARQELATSVQSDLSDNEDGGYYAPIVILAGGKSVEAAEAALAAELARVRDLPVTAAELCTITQADIRASRVFSGGLDPDGSRRKDDPHEL